MPKKILLASIVLFSLAIFALAIAGQGDPNGASDKPNPPADKPQKEAPTDSNETQNPPAQTNENPSMENGQLELPDQSPLPAFYTTCQSVYGLCVNDNGEVDYALLRRKRNDLLYAFRILEAIHPAQIMAMSDAEKQAFWINTYNLCTLKLIIDNYPIEPKWYMILYPNNSIMQISNPWTKNYFKIQGLEYNLQEIERELLLERFGDPRICFALSNSTRGGAFLRKEPYRAETLKEQLDDQVRRYLGSQRGLRWDNNNATLFISNLFNMNRDVFLKSSYAEIKKFRQRKDDERVWLNFIITYLPAEQSKLLETTDYTLKFIDYDWTLNNFSSQ